MLLDPDTRAVKVAGFGLARRDPARPSAAPYTSPEVARLDELANGGTLLQRRKVDWLAADVFAVGVVLWEMWFRTKPYQQHAALQLEVASARAAEAEAGVDLARAEAAAAAVAAEAAAADATLSGLQGAEAAELQAQHEVSLGQTRPASARPRRPL